MKRAEQAEAQAKQAHAHAAPREPWVRMVKRESIGRGKAALIRAAAVLGALLTGALIILLLGHDPIAVYGDMIVGSLGSTTVLLETLRIAIPLLITALAIALAFRMRFWNIGAEGQILVGAMAASYFALFQYQNMPRLLLLLCMAAAAMVAGGLWGLIPAIFKARWNTNETLFTLMLNYIALCFLKYLQNGPWKDPTMRGFPKIAMFNEAARLPKVFGLHIGWIVALVLVVFVTFYLSRTKQGYEIAVVGESQNTARYAGMRVGKILMRTMILSGALCGLVGFLQVSGADYTLTDTTAGGVGFTAITVAWMSKLNPAVMTVVALAIAVLEKGSNKIQTTFKIPASAADVLTGIVLFFLLGCEFFINYRLVFRHKSAAKPEKEEAHG